jgi:hypothetical protein
MANDKKFIETVFEKVESLDEFNRECIGHYDADR